MKARTTELKHDARVLGLALIALLLWESSGLDLVVVRWYGSAHGFAWRDAWLTSTVLHKGGRVLAWGLLAIMFAYAWWPLLTGPSRTERALWLAVTLLCLLLIPAIKHASKTSCPWDLAEFGGVAAYVPHWRFDRIDGGSGHCFPSGHAVAASAFFSGYFLLRAHRLTFARCWLAGVCALLLLFGWAQLARGAHYPSHTFWSAWLCWAVCALAARVASAGQRVTQRISSVATALPLISTSSLAAPTR